MDDGRGVEEERIGALKQMGHPSVPVEEVMTQVTLARPVGVMLDLLTAKIRGGADPLRRTGVAGF